MGCVGCFSRWFRVDWYVSRVNVTIIGEIRILVINWYDLPRGACNVKIRMGRAVLRRVIQLVSRAITPRSPLPVLGGIWVEAVEDQVHFTGSNADVRIRTACSMQDSPESIKNLRQVVVEQEGQAVLPGRILSDIMRKIPEGEVSIEVMGNFEVDFRIGSSHFQLHGFDPLEYPRLAISAASTGFSMQASDLKSMLKNTVFAASITEARGVLTGVCLGCHADLLTAIATDTFRLSKWQTPISNPKNVHPEDIVIPGHSVHELLKIMDDADEVSCQVVEGHWVVSTGEWWFATRLLGGAYPDISKVIPQEAPVRVRLPLANFLGAVGRASLISRDHPDRLIQLVVENDRISVAAIAAGVGSVAESLPATVEGEPMTLAFNATYLVDSLEAFSGADEVEMLLPGPQRPCRIQVPGIQTAMQLVVPVRTEV